MSNTIVKQKLLEWSIGKRTIPEAIPYRDDWTRGYDRAMEHVEAEIQSGRFDIDQGEVQRLRAALADLREFAFDNNIEAWIVAAINRRVSEALSDTQE